MFSISAGLAYLVTAFMPERPAKVAAPPPAPYTLPHLIAWLEKHPVDRFYDYRCGHSCVFAQYANSMNREHYWSEALNEFANIYGADTVSSEGRIRRIARNVPHTFGAALGRARALEALWQNQ